MSKQQQERYPKPPFPKEDIKRPGREEDMKTKPCFSAPNYKGSGKLEGKTALITGGDSGIGRSVAILFAREGADVAIVYLSPEERDDAERVRSFVEAEGRRCFLIEGNVGFEKNCEAIMGLVMDEFGKIDILVNNAAFQNHLEKIEDLSEAQWRQTFRTNIDGYFFMTKEALKFMKEGGSIINCGSVTGLEGSPGLLDYSATKGAIHAFTKSLAKQLVDRKIRVNCVAPGPVWTPLNPAERSDDETRHFGEGTAYGRPAQPEEIAPAFVFFASDVDSSYVTGEVLALLGGETRAA